MMPHRLDMQLKQLSSVLLFMVFTKPLSVNTPKVLGCIGHQIVESIFNDLEVEGDFLPFKNTPSPNTDSLKHQISKHIVRKTHGQLPALQIPHLLTGPMCLGETRWSKEEAVNASLFLTIQNHPVVVLNYR